MLNLHINPQNGAAVKPHYDSPWIYNEMKYMLIAGEASGDLHASRLIAALRKEDPEAEFRFFGGDLMAKSAGRAPELHYDKFVLTMLTSVFYGEVTEPPEEPEGKHAAAAGQAAAH